MVDYELAPEDFLGLLHTMDGTVLALPELVMAAVTAGEDLAAALQGSNCPPSVRFIAEDVLRPDLSNLTLGCENVVGAGHAVHSALGDGDTEMAENAIGDGVR